MSVTLAPPMFLQFFAPSGAPLSGGCLFTYVGGTTTKQATWTTQAQNVLNANPIILDQNGVAQVWGDPTLTYKFVLAPANSSDPPTSTLYSTDNLQFPVTASTMIAILGSTRGAIGQALWPITTAETLASVTPTNFAYDSGPPIDVRRFGALFNNEAVNASIETLALNNAIAVASQIPDGTLGNAVVLPNGISIINAEVTLPNRVRIFGQNKRGSEYQAISTWVAGTNGAYVFHAVNGTSSMFDSTLENLTVDANNIAGVGCVLSDAWQEDCGLRGVLLINFATFGLKLQNGFGGAATLKLIDIEIFGGSTTNAVGIDCESIGISGAFVLHVTDGAIAGGSVNLAKCINMVNDCLQLENFHFETATTGVYLAGLGSSELRGVTGNASVTNFVEIDANFTGQLKMTGCYPNGTATMVLDHRVAQIAQLGSITGGSLYTTGTYNNVALTGGSGTTATAQIVVSGGAVTAVTIAQPGTGYVIADTLSASAANIGGTGSGFSVPVFDIFTGVGTVTNTNWPVDYTLPTYIGGSRGPNDLVSWGIFDGTKTGTNPAIRGCNVKSIQRTGAGLYTVTLIQAMVSANCSLQANSGTNNQACTCNQVGAASFTIRCAVTTTGTATDSSVITFQVAGS